MTAIVGHENIQAQLASTTAHALLLCGPSRVGRRKLAHWWAQRQNCTQTNAPCGTCASCRLNPHPDILEVAPKTLTQTGRLAREKIIPIAAVSRSHDRTHEYETHILDWLETRAFARHKVVIVDGAEFLNEAAANALLKVVEEPPHGAKFVFLSEDDSGVLPTIVSRSVRLRVPSVEALTLEREWLRTHGALDTTVLDFVQGRPGLLLDEATTRAALEAATEFLNAVERSAIDAITEADRLEKLVERDAALRALFPDALLFVTRHHSPARRAALDNALQETLVALEGYANPSLCFAVLALAWRETLGGP